eukprot:3822804-Prymnesium_polylepis.1
MRLSRRSVILLVPAASALGRPVSRVIVWGPLRVQSSRSGEELCVYVRWVSFEVSVPRSRC